MSMQILALVVVELKMALELFGEITVEVIPHELVHKLLVAAQLLVDAFSYFSLEGNVLVMDPPVVKVLLHLRL